MRKEETDTEGAVVTFEDCVCTDTTDTTILVDGIGILTEPMWIPRDMISTESEVKDCGDAGELVLIEWFADKNGLTAPKILDA